MKKSDRADYIAFIDLSIPNGFARHAYNVASVFASYGIETAMWCFPPGSRAGAKDVAKLFARSIVRIIFGSGLVVLSTQANHLQALLAAAACLRGRRIVYDMQDLTPESFLHLYGKTLPKPALALANAWLRVSEKIICRLSDAVLVVSPGMRNTISKRSCEHAKILLFPNRHSLETLEPSPRDLRPTIVYAGGLQPVYRGIEVQIEALTAMLDWQMLIAGEGDERWLRDLVTKYELEDRVRFFGFVSPAQVRAMLLSAHVLVIEGVAYGLPSKFFEAVGAGVVVVSPRSAVDVNAILGTSAVTFDGSPSELRAALEFAWNHLNELRARQHTALQNFIRDVDFEYKRLEGYLKDGTMKPEEVPALL